MAANEVDYVGVKMFFKERCLKLSANFHHSPSLISLVINQREVKKSQSAASTARERIGGGGERERRQSHD